MRGRIPALANERAFSAPVAAEIADKGKEDRMIRYALRCDKEHEFEAWFRSSARLRPRGCRRRDGCPICGPARVEKMPMAPAVARSGNQPAEKDNKPVEKSEKMRLVAAPDPQQQALIQAMRELRRR